MVLICHATRWRMCQRGTEQKGLQKESCIDAAGMASTAKPRVERGRLALAMSRTFDPI